MSLRSYERAVLRELPALARRSEKLFERLVARLRGLGHDGRGPKSDGRGLVAGLVRPEITYNDEDSTSTFIEYDADDWPLVRDHGSTWLPASLSYQDLYDNTIKNQFNTDISFKFRAHIYSGSAGNTVEARLLVDGVEEFYESDTSNHNVVWDWTIPAGSSMRFQVQGRDSDEAGNAQFQAYDGELTSPPQISEGPAEWLSY